MSMDYVRKTYGVPAKRGGLIAYRTKYRTRMGRITKATHHIYVRFEDAQFSVPIHPTDEHLTYLPPNAEGQVSS